VRGIKGNESGLWLTPTATDMSVRSEEAMEKRKDYRSKIGRKTVPPGSLSEQVMYGKPIVNMYPTPTQDSASERTKKYSQGGMPLPMAVKMFPTPTAGCVEGGEQSSRVEMTESGGFILRKKNKPENTFGAKLSDAMLYLEKKKQTKLGGKLNPNFVEFLMGYPTNWTKIDPTE
jgi:hypothetical protein